MRFGWVLGAILIVVTPICKMGPAAAQAMTSTSNSPLSEFRFGLSAQDPWGRENGSANAVGEILFSRPFTAADLFTSYFLPRPHLGGSVNMDGKTSYAYAGLTWSFDVTQRVFLEGTFGAAVHDGSTKKISAEPDRQAFGCASLFRESGALGVRLSGNWSVMATVERLSSHGACGDDKGLTNFGARIGYAF